MDRQYDFGDHFSSQDSDLADNGYVVAVTRSRLASTSTTDPQLRLWSRDQDCSQLTNNPLPMACVLPVAQYTFGNISSNLIDPFLAQLPSGYSTGLIRQFAPRINSSSFRADITADQFPKGCSEIPGAFYVRYANSSSTYGSYSFEACMPANMSVSPWRTQRSRQDFTEELYLNISLPGNFYGVTPGVYYSKITVNTTAGYFELPNYMNGQTAGPLLGDDPSNHCGLDCFMQGFGGNPISDHNITNTSRDVSNGTQEHTAANATLSLDGNLNKGPLLTVAMALFGLGSFIDTRAAASQAYVSNYGTSLTRQFQCLEVVPFMALLRDQLNQGSLYNNLATCLNTVDASAGAFDQSVWYLWAFVFNDLGVERIQNAFTAAAYLANEAWMFNPYGGEPSLTVTYDQGADTTKPDISTAGIAVVSLLLGSYVLGLLAMAVYSCWTRRWTETLDAWAIMRMGIAVRGTSPPGRLAGGEQPQWEREPLLYTGDVEQVAALDGMPGWIGDRTEGQGEVGELGIGAEMRLRGERRYRSFEPEDGRDSCVLLSATGSAVGRRDDEYELVGRESGPENEGPGER